MKVKSLWDVEEPVVNNKDYLILAGESKYGRQQYLGGYKDCSNWYISIVPCVVKYDKAQKLIKKATKALEKRVSRFGGAIEIPKFELKEVEVDVKNSLCSNG